MKGFIFAAISAAVILCALPACSKDTDYTLYISEKRSEIYLYSDDEVDFKIYCVEREQPYLSDGICGEMCKLVEVYAAFPAPPESAEVQIGGFSGEMNYEAVEMRFALTYSAEPFSADGVDVKLAYGGTEKSFRALNVADGGVLSCEQAVRYAAEYDRELFQSLTKKKGFDGEIYVRLLYDEGCYYYVGVCDRDKNVSAYLLDGVKGKVISRKKLNA